MLRLSFSKKQILIEVLKIIIVFGVLLIVAYLGISWSFGRTIAQKSWLNPNFWAEGFLIVLGFLTGATEVWLLGRLDVWLDKRIFSIKNAFKGNWGEKKTFERLSEMLGDRYKIYRNFHIPGKKFDIDAMIVGPKGIITFEIKNLGTEKDVFRFEGSDMYKVTRYSNGNECVCRMANGYKSGNPIGETKRHNQALEEWLMKNGYGDIRVKGAILMASDAKIESLKSPAVYVIKGFDDIKRYIAGAFEDQRFNEEFCAKLNNLLDVRS